MSPLTKVRTRPRAWTQHCSPSQLAMPAVTSGQHPPGNSTDSCTEARSLNAPQSPQESPTLSPLPCVLSTTRSTHQGFSCDSLGHKYCRAAHSAPLSFQTHPPSWSTEARKLNTPFTNSLTTRFFHANTPHARFEGREEQQ